MQQANGAGGQAQSSVGSGRAVLVLVRILAFLVAPFWRAGRKAEQASDDIYTIY